MLKYLRPLGIGVLALTCTFAAFAATRTVSMQGFSPNEACVGNAQLLALAVQQYTQDYDERFPPMDTQSHFEAAVAPYVKNPNTFVCPATHQFYQPNAALNGMVMAQIDNPATTIVIQDSVAHNDGLTTLAFVNLHIERGGVEPGDPNAFCIRNARILSLAIQQYSQDYDEVLPRTDTQAHFQQDLLPYAKDPRFFVCPVTHDLFQPNPAISRKAIYQITQDPKTIITFQDTAPHADGASTIAYLDGHVTHGDFTTLKRTDAQNERLLVQAVQSYAVNNSDYLPPTDTYYDFRIALQTYINNDHSVFFNPDTHQPYVVSPYFSQMQISPFDNLSRINIIQDAQLNDDGTFNTAYLDGHVATKYYFVPKTLTVGTDNVTHLLWDRADGNAALWTLSQTGDFLTSQTITGDPNSRIIGLTPGSQTTTDLFWNNRPLASFWAVSPSNMQTTRTDVGPYDGWTPVALTSGADFKPRELWSRYDGQAAIWQVSATGEYLADARIGPDPDPAYKPVAMAAGPDNYLRLLFTKQSGYHNYQNSFKLWTLDGQGHFLGRVAYGPIFGQTPIALTLGPDDLTRILWHGIDGRAMVWTMSTRGMEIGAVTFSPDPGWQAIAVGVGSDHNLRLLWKNVDGSASLRIYTPNGTLLTHHEFAPFQ